MSTPFTIWLRAECKTFEQRTPLTPVAAAALVDAGISVIVERSDARAYPDGDYASVGCSLVAAGSWESAPMDACILGLKELPESTQPLRHRHIYFAHAYKGQAGWRELLLRFRRGDGVLYDLEYLVDPVGRRVAAFGHWAGFAGAAIASLAWSARQCEELPDLAPLTAYPNRRALIERCRQQLNCCPEVPGVLIIGAAGRCGGGAAELLGELDVNVTLWDLEETRNGGPFEQILEHDVFVNCVFVSKRIPPFLTAELLSGPRRLSIICDVSCDPYGDLNPLPFYSRCTTFADPLQRVADGENPLDLIAIDHLPSLLPKESSEDFSNQLLPHLFKLDADEEGVWAGARRKFEQTLQEL
ncbi:MAG: saccharopine dehydrogenase [Planctomycetota bacterium]|jgi:saccharopine dehydrogenase (NAD+, L-lysine-forming)|nr:saccharopine dehydrogenase [Planctomycetota bacterium]